MSRKPPKVIYTGGRHIMEEPEDLAFDILASIWEHVTDTGQDATRLTLTQIMKPLEQDIKAYIK